MNAPANISQDARECAAFFSLSQTQRRIAHDYKRRAMAEKAAGDVSRFDRYSAEANRLWAQAKWHLQMAKRRAAL